MSVPGSNMLARATRLIAQSQFKYFVYQTRTLQANGLYVSVYKYPLSLRGSVQPIPRNLYEQYGLDFQNNYINVYLQKNTIDVSRDVAGDKIVFNCNTYQVLSKTPWAAIDYWDAVLCVEVPNA